VKQKLPLGFLRAVNNQYNITIKSSILFLSLLLINLQSRAQQSAEVLFQTGKIVKNYPRFPERHDALLTRLTWNEKLNGKAAWHQCYHFPELTIQATTGPLGNHQELGNIYGLTAGFRIVKELQHHFALTAEACLGAAYFDTPFDELHNFNNVAIGSDVTVQATADGGVIYIMGRWSVLARMSILHCSNSHISLPNAGINLPMLSAGLRYSFSPLKERLQQPEPLVDKKPKLNFRVALGLNEQGGTAGPVNGPRYGVFLAAAYIYRHYTPVARWQMGLEGYYNQGNYIFITSQRYYHEKEKLRSSALLYMLGHEYIFGHVSFVTQGGLYLYNPLARDRYHDLAEPEVRDYLRTLFTARLGLQYYLFSTFNKKHNNIFAGCYAKTNFGKADFIEFSLGYNF
jgi:hypothetical protein